MDSNAQPQQSGQPPSCDRRDVLHWAARLSAACLAGPVTLADAQSPLANVESPLATRRYGRSLLVDKHGQPFKGRQLATGEAHIFQYPYQTTPVFLIALPRAATPVALANGNKHKNCQLQKHHELHHVKTSSSSNVVWYKRKRKCSRSYTCMLSC